MSWLFSQALVEEYLGDICSDGEPSAQLSGNPTQQAYCAPDKMTKFSRLSRYGMTFKPLTADRGEELLTLYLAAFPVRTSQQPDEVQELTAQDPECGHTWQELLARYDPNTSTWKTPQSSLLGDYTEFSETWPRWGLMRDGVSYQQQTLVPPTSETEFGLLPTPLASLGTNGGPNQRDSSGRPGLQMAAMKWRTPQTGDAKSSIIQQGHQTNLTHQVMKWPTPISQDAKHSGYAPSGPGKADKLSYAVVRWPTPQAHNAKETNAPNEYLRNAPSLTALIHTRAKEESEELVGGKLNPTWVEWLMGWPLGWTDLKPLAMAKFLSWQRQHGVSSSEET